MSLATLAVSLEKGLRSIFIAAMLSQPGSIANDIATTVPSDADLETYGWMDSLPQVREFLTERQISGLGEARYQIQNREWELTIGVKRKDIKDDRLGALPIRIGQMAEQADDHKNQLVVDTLVAGDSTAGYDGANYFSTTHPNRGSSGVQSNLHTGTGTTTAQFRADFQSVMTAKRRRRDEAGKPFRRRFGRMLVLIPPELETVAREALQAPILVGGGTNVMVNQADIIIVPELADTNDWYVLHVGGVLKPIIFQLREGVEFSALEGESESGFMRNAYYYGTYARYGAGYGFWQDADKVTNV